MRSSNATRQGGPRAHSINPSPDNRYVVAADLGLDKLLVYRFDPLTGTLTPNEPPFACKKPDEFLFWDGIHPTKSGHAILAEEAARLLLQ